MLQKHWELQLMDTARTNGGTDLYLGRYANVFSELYAKHLTPGTFCGYLEPSDHHFLPQIVLMDLQGII
jgi:hypothetical protein